MRVACFFFLSVAVHAFALAYPLSFAEPNRAELIRVTVLPLEAETHSGASKAPGSAGKSQSQAKSPEHKPRALQHTARLTLNHAPTTDLVTAPPNLIEERQSAETLVPPSSNENDYLNTGYSAEGVKTGDGAVGEAGETGLASGVGSGSFGSGSGTRAGVTLTQARYRDTPEPSYPESARQQGREGTVLLRVLVDNQGRAKSVEISKSSGDDALDRAAGEAIKRWRFIPAHYGDNAIESWIRIPVDFRLTENSP